MWRVAGRYLEPLLTLDNVHEAHSRPRQQLPEVWWQNGYVDVVRPHTILELDSMAGERVLPFFVDDAATVEIDHAEDLRRAEMLLRGEPARVQRRRPR
jgi:N-acylneuraminate cytidylyltransferase